MQLIECKVKFDALSEEGLVRRVSEIHLTDALSFSEAEKMVSEAVQPLVTGDFGFCHMKLVSFNELVIEKKEGDSFFIAKVNALSIDEERGTEKRLPLKWLLTATDIDAAKRKVDDMIRSAIGTMVLSEIKESKIVSFVSETDVTEEDDNQPEE